MKLIEALKKINRLLEKASDLETKVKRYHAISSIETATYENQKDKIAEWMQAHSDIIKEVLNLRLAIQRTNLNTMVTIELGEKSVTKSIAGWIHRRRDLATKELGMWRQLTDNRIREGTAKNTAGDPVEIKIVRFYDPERRDTMQEMYASEPSIIDARLEIVNAVTDLQENEPDNDAKALGLVYDFVGYLTTRNEVLKLGATEDAAPAADAIKAFCEERGIEYNQDVDFDWRS